VDWRRDSHGFAKEKPPWRPRTADFTDEVNTVDLGGEFDRRSIMAILVAKVLFFVWAAQLIWIASNLLESRVKKISRLVTTLAIQKDRPKAASLQR
jgi:hypothetical protein